MADPRFFDRAGPFRLDELSLIGRAEVAPGSDPALVLSDVAPLDAAGPGHLSFLDNRKYIGAFAASRAAACVVTPALAGGAPAGMALLLSDHPYRSYARIAQAFYPRPPVAPGVAPSAHVDSTAALGADVEIGPGAVVEARAEIGARCRIAPNAVIGAGVVVGEDTTIGANASLSHCRIGRRVLIHPGVRIGQDGFGFAIDPAGHVKVPQLGRVIVHDDVEIGANTTIDRGAGPDTVIGRGCMIDNLVQIGHNVEVGPGSVIVAQAGVAGSSKLAEFVVLAGQAGIAGHLNIGAGARIAAQSGVARNVAPGEEVGGSPAMPIRQFWRLQAKLSKLLNEQKGR